VGSGIVAPDDRPSGLGPREREHAVKTWRYLRIAMVVLVFGLAASILRELWRVDFDCVRTSISAYYHSPVRGFFVGALVGIGVCLVCLKGNRDSEDIILNLAGMFAPVVAFVPTTGPGGCPSAVGATDVKANVANNVTALLAVGAVGLVVLAVLGVRGLLGRRSPPTGPEIVGFALAALAAIVTAAVFWGDRDLFVRKAHFPAAVLMFACIFVVVWINALGHRASARSPRNPYSAIAVAMALSASAIYMAGKAGWDYWVLAIEAALICLFAIFWVIQTRELWDTGLRLLRPAAD
jgi:hypothetical protein